MANRNPLYAAGSSRNVNQMAEVKRELNVSSLDTSYVVSAHGYFSRMPNSGARSQSMGNPGPQGQPSGNRTAQNLWIPQQSPQTVPKKSQPIAPVRAKPENRDKIPFNYQLSQPEPVASVDHEEEVITNESAFDTEDPMNRSSTESDYLEILPPGQNKLYQCKQCWKCFVSGRRLGRHSRLAHSLKFSCSVCDQRSRTAETRNKHEKTAHGLVRAELVDSEERLPNKTLKRMLMASRKDKFRGRITRTASCYLIIKAEPIDENDPMPPPRNDPKTTQTQSETWPTNTSLPLSSVSQTPEAFDASHSGVPIITAIKICKMLSRSPTILYYDYEERQKQIGTLPLEIFRDSPQCVLLLVRTKTPTLRNHPQLTRAFQKIAMPRILSNGEERPSYVLCYGKEDHPLVKSFKNTTKFTMKFNELADVIGNLECKSAVLLSSEQDSTNLNDTSNQLHVL
ncbi:hypothetical protein M3Y98_00780400 [Aphelenchoides besseyi]|nr:hypothetical protein M3Y98_00780400 [Aphelenchoides besseyi]KAI6211831.1 hypothetical protein M3Y96_00476000 [Aphelenchoides besseyi]